MSGWKRMGDELPPTSGWYEVRWPDTFVVSLVWLTRSSDVDDNDSINGITWADSQGDDPESIVIACDTPGEIEWRPFAVDT